MGAVGLQSMSQVLFPFLMFALKEKRPRFLIVIHITCYREDIEEGELIWWADAESLRLREQLHLVVDLKTFETWPKEKQDKFMELAYQIDEDHLEGFHGKVARIR
jgi:hypothetical protein